MIQARLYGAFSHGKTGETESQKSKLIIVILFLENLNVARDEVEGNGGKQIITLLTNDVLTAVNISRVIVNCFLFDVIVIAICCPLMAFGGKQFHC